VVLGLLLGIFIDNIRTKRRFKKELKDNNFIDISGKNWFAAWHTSVDQTINLNTEELEISQRGQTVKIWNIEKAPENPKGGYLWSAQLQFFHGKTLMGWYFPLRHENITSKGIMFLTYQSAKKIFWGKWVGENYDGALSNGFVVISKNRDESLRLLKDVIRKHTDKVNIIYDAI
jgi:hypothetical protein